MVVIVLWSRIVCETKIQFVFVEYHCAIHFTLSPLGALNVAEVADTQCPSLGKERHQKEKKQNLCPPSMWCVIISW